MNQLLLREIADKYYDGLEAMVNDLARKCVGGEEVRVNFPVGKVIIVLK